MSDKWNTWLRATFTAAILAAAAWWLWLVAHHIGDPPHRDDEGNVVDQYQRAKDILLVVLPLVTTTFGYWFGVHGKARAEDRADKAQTKLNAVISNAPPEALEQAREKYPEAFTVDGKTS